MNSCHKPLLVRMLLLGCSCALLCGQGAIAADGWEGDIKGFEQQDERQPPPEHPVVFVGSSSIRFWDLKKWFPDLPALNRGFGGSTVIDVVHYVDRIVLKYQPRVIVFYSGDNDIAGGKSPEQVAADFDEFYKAVRAKLPEARLIFVPTKPSLQRWNLVEKMRDANDRIRKLGQDDPRFVYADTSTPMLATDGKPRPELFQGDGLHLNDEGYKLWTSIVKPLIEEPAEKK